MARSLTKQQEEAIQKMTVYDEERILGDLLDKYWASYNGSLLSFLLIRLNMDIYGNLLEEFNNEIIKAYLEELDF